MPWRGRSEGWIALIAPAGVAKQMGVRLYADVKTALVTKEVQDSFAAQGMIPLGVSPEESAQTFQSDVAP